jgi:hypothetical protein
MGAAHEPGKVRLFLAFLYSPGFEITPVINKLRERFGPEEFFFGPIAFDYTDYYTQEMGNGLQKKYFVFNRTESRDTLPQAKVFTNDIEKEYSVDGRRAINLDPGYLARDKLVLATTKDFFHRLYISNGIYAEVTLHFKGNGTCRYFSWTYQDYRDNGFTEFILSARKGVDWKGM